MSDFDSDTFSDGFDSGWDTWGRNEVNKFGVTFKSNEIENVYVENASSDYTFGKKTERAPDQISQVISVNDISDIFTFDLETDEISDNNIGFALGFDINGKFIEAINNDEPVVLEELEEFSSLVRRKLRVFLPEIPKAQLELVNNFLDKYKVRLDSELIYSDIGFQFSGTSSSHDKLNETRVVREVVGSNKISLSTVNGQIDKFNFQPKIGQTSSAFYDISNMEVHARILVTKELGSNLKGVSEGKVITAAIGLIDTPNTKSLFKRATIVPLSELIEIGKHSNDQSTVFVDEFSASDKRAFIERFLKYSQLQVAFDASHDEPPVIKATLNPLKGGLDADMEIPSIKLQIIKGEEALIGIGGSVKDVSHPQQFKLSVYDGNYGKQLRITEYQSQNYESFVSFSMDISGVDVGNFEMAYSGPNGFEFIDVKYRLGASSSVLEITDQDNTLIQMVFIGERGDSVKIIETKEDGSYMQLNPLELFESRADLFVQLYQDLKEKGGVLNHMEAFFSVFDGKNLTNKKKDTTVGMPLEKFRWESEFGPDPEGIVLDPRNSSKLPGTPLHVPMIFTKESPAKIAHKQEAFEILKTLDFVVASENYVSDVLRGKRRGYITTTPKGKSDTLPARIFESSRGDYLIDGFVNRAKEDQAVYFYTLALEIWRLDGICNLDRIDRDHEVFVSKLSVDEAKIAKLEVVQAGDGREKGDCKTIGDLSEEETLVKLREISKNYYNQTLNGLTITPSHFSGNMGYRMTDYYALAKQKLVYAPANTKEFLSIFKR